MKDLANDIAHIFFTMLVLILPVVWWWGAIPSGLLIGLLVELKEEDSDVTKWESWGHISVRDLLGYVGGGIALSIILFFLRR